MGLGTEFVGLSKKDAQNKAEMNNLIFRLIRVDARWLQSYPDDVREDRVCIEIDKNKVTIAKIQ
jgi:hypothetical protein